ncbi:gamma-aminobutyrate permease [Macrococcus epidermidis]|uniref:Gamma-aminobutyrate permease n=1 Tax=Macrococcus epidermidis TaxID=1902580 RepID=A0A327ZZQ3_9STAP|nr:MULTISPECIES: amino acid permease [Macrococcus]MCG7419711.1 amino acid permease [Macrococcus epidermidis]MCH4984020.1 amino acid permease [Macrococcus sp. PK]RAK47064.1 gamma-aminobutyrate permease [Macrococcus epidermidis]UTH15503.1 amino acid permease [Macrococcus epidermidis]
MANHNRSIEERNDLQRSLSNRHIQLIAIGGAIGTGLFLGAGKSINLAGPSILFTYIIIGLFLFLFMRALGELLLSNTNYHSFTDIARDYLGDFAGYITGWTYWFCWVVTGMAEVTAIAKYVQFWWPDFPTWLSSLLCILVLMFLNLLTAKLFGELEFWFALIKVITIIALIITGIVLIVIGFKTNFGVATITNLWSHGGFFPNGTNGFLLSFQMAIFSFVGIELIGVTAGEAQDPEKTLPRAINSVPMRIVLFYIGSLIIIMSVTPWDKIDPNESPFVKFFGLIGIGFAASLINFVVITSAASSCNSGIFSNSRMLFGLSKNYSKGNDSFFQRTNKAGVPANAVVFSSVLLLLSVLLNYFMPNANAVFTLVTTVATVFFIVVWSIILAAYLVYLKRRPQLHQSSLYKLPGGKISAIAILLFFVFMFGLLFMAEDTRMGLFVSPLWFVLLAIMYAAQGGFKKGSFDPHNYDNK